MMTKSASRLLVLATGAEPLMVTRVSAADTADVSLHDARIDAVDLQFLTPLDASGPMTHEKFARYVQVFNSHDLRFAQFYTPDGVLENGLIKSLRGASSNTYAERGKQ